MLMALFCIGIGMAIPGNYTTTLQPVLSEFKVHLSVMLFFTLTAKFRLAEEPLTLFTP